MPSPKPTLSEQIEQAASELHILDGVARALAEPVETLAVIAGADDVDDARAALKERFGLDDIQARAVLDLQFRRAPRAERDRILARHRELTDLLIELRTQAGEH